MSERSERVTLAILFVGLASLVVLGEWAQACHPETPVIDASGPHCEATS